MSTNTNQLRLLPEPQPPQADPENTKTGRQARQVPSNAGPARVLSVPEPLATLILLAIKRIYTTGRYTTHQGTTLIFTPGLGRLPVQRIPPEALQAIEGREMHRQAVIGQVNLKVAAPTEGLNPKFAHHGLTPLELALDDFSPDRYALYLEDPAWLEKPIPATGRGQLWRAGPELLTLLEAQGIE